MKHNFDFHLSGKKFFPVWIIYYLLVIAPYFLLLRMAETMENSAVMGLGTLLLMFFMFAGTLVYYYYFVKFCVNSLSYNRRPLHFSGRFGTYIGKALLGLFLSGITFGIYLPWFIRNLMKYFLNNTSLDDSNFDFSGNPAQLLVILLLTLYLPVGLMMIIIVLITVLTGGEAMSSGVPFIAILMQLVIFVLLIPYMYFTYKWLVDIKYKGYAVRWKTEFWPSCLQILVQLLLTVVTVGIYFPLAYLKLYKYFTERTFAESPAKTMNFGYELDASGDFLFVWGQTLLAIITLGIYYPWAIAKIGKRVLAKTYTWVVSESEALPVTPPPVPL